MRFGGAGIEMQGRCTVTFGFQDILMPRLAPDPSNNSRPAILKTRVTQFTESLSMLKKNKTATKV